MPIIFNGMMIEMQRYGMVSLNMTDHVNRLYTIPQKHVQQDYVKVRAKVLYRAAVKMPNITLKVSPEWQVQNSTKSYVAYLNRSMLSLKCSPTTLRFVHVDPFTALIFIITNATFAIKTYHMSQLVVILFLSKNLKNCNILYYSSIKPMQVSCSILAA